MFEVFDSMIEKLLQAGFINCYLEHHENDLVAEFKRMEEHKMPFKVLTLDELKAGFVISISPLILSFAVFCFEWLISLKDLFVFLSIFKTYFKMRKDEQEKKIEWGKIKVVALQTLVLEETALARPEI